MFVNSVYISTGVFALYPCNNTVRRQDVLTEFRINAFTRDKEYQPIVLYIPKACSEVSPEGGNNYLASYIKFV